jgi:type IV pilus assembly protein PilA
MRTPEAPQPAQAKYSLPTVALILSVLGICFCPTALVGSILGIVAWVRISKEPHLPGKGLAIAATFIPLALVPIVGIQAAIAIPNFIRFQARSKQSECKTALRAIANAQRSFHDQDGHFAATFEELGVVTPEANRYAYFLSDAEIQHPDTALHPEAAGVDYAGALKRSGLEVGVGEDYTAACVGNVDQDQTLDVWTVSSAPRTSPQGEAIPPGTPYNDVNDVTE